MKIVYYFRNDPAHRDDGGRSDFRYTYIQFILKGYIATCAQRISTFVTEFVIDAISREFKERLIFPIEGYYSVRPARRKNFLACESFYALYFNNLSVLEVEKLDSYLMANEGYLGCCQIQSVANRAFSFNSKPPFLEIKRRTISILTDSLHRIEDRRDGSWKTLLSTHHLSLGTIRRFARHLR